MPNANACQPPGYTGTTATDPTPRWGLPPVSRVNNLSGNYNQYTSVVMGEDSDNNSACPFCGFRLWEPEASAVVQCPHLIADWGSDCPDPGGGIRGGTHFQFFGWGSPEATPNCTNECISGGADGVGQAILALLQDAAGDAETMDGVTEASIARLQSQLAHFGVKAWEARHWLANWVDDRERPSFDDCFNEPCADFATYGADSLVSGRLASVPVIQVVVATPEVTTCSFTMVFAEDPVAGAAAAAAALTALTAEILVTRSV